MTTSLSSAKDIVRDLGRYWWEIAPEGKAFRRHEAIRLAVGMARRYEAAPVPDCEGVTGMQANRHGRAWVPVNGSGRPDA